MWHLDNFSNEKLIDIVKNYEQYKYDIEVKFQAIEILNSKGITQNEIESQDVQKLTNYEHRKTKLKRAFRIYSIIAFCLYIGAIAFQFFVSSYQTLIIFVAVLILYLVSVSLSYICQKKFYTHIQKPTKSTNPILFFAVGVPFYFIFFWFAINDLKDEENKESL